MKLNRPVAAAMLVLHLCTASLAGAEGLPDLGDVSDASLSEPQERTIGKRIMLEIRADRAYIDDSELVAYINALGGRLVSASRGTTNDNRRDFEFFILDDESINAFALPGGYIGVHSGLFLTSTTESELAGVLGHEIAHVLQRHQARGIDSQKGSALVQLLGIMAAVVAARSNSSSGGQAAEAAIYSTAALQAQSQLNYSRDFEREADRLGIQVLTRAGFDPNGMVGFFERMLRANRHNDGKLPGYLRTHPLTTDRIADMQNRVEALRSDTLKADNAFDGADGQNYRFARAKLRVLTMGANDSIAYFRNVISEQTVLRNRADIYGLALALARARNFAAAAKELSTIRSSAAPNPWIENLAAEIEAGQRHWPEAVRLYRTSWQAFPEHRALFYGYVETLYEAGQVDAALALLADQLKNIQDDAKLFELSAKGYERKNKRMAQHRAIGEAYYRRGNLQGAVVQLELAAKAKDGDFYEISSTEARLREFKSALRNRPLLPGEKNDPERDPKDQLQR